ncbi:MAG: hypothetical protein JWP91_2823 [Fibrobacteres bacterium]|nr:hypothetical protein [Fibrobacterota bacterium]
MTSATGPLIRIGCAGWALDKALQPLFPGAGTHLQRYAAVFPCVEINSSFYRPHKRATYVKWADSVPDGFRFCVKVPKTLTHDLRLRAFEAPMDRFLEEATGLGEKLGPLLVQLPPSLKWEEATAGAFLAGLRKRHSGQVALEPRHATWFSKDAGDFLAGFSAARVAADPAAVPEASAPGGWDGFVYRRLHGSPRMYYSAYSPDFLEGLAGTQAREAESGETYCIFDNTAERHAIPDAMALIENVSRGAPSIPSS